MGWCHVLGWYGLCLFRKFGFVVCERGYFGDGRQLMIVNVVVVIFDLYDYVL